MGKRAATATHMSPPIDKKADLAGGGKSSVSHLQAREDKRQRRWAVFASNLWEVRERSSVKKKEEEKRAERVHDSSRTRPVTHLGGPPLHGLPLRMYPFSNRKSPAHIPQKRGGACSCCSGSKGRGRGGVREESMERKPVRRHTWRHDLSHHHLVVVLLALGHTALFVLRIVGSITPPLRPVSYIEHHRDPEAMH